MRRFLLLALVTGCSCGGDDDGMPNVDAGPLSDSGGGRDGRVDVEMCRAALPVDMIWMIDNSNSMGEEQASLAMNFPLLIEALTNPPDSDGDGEQDFPPVQDLRIGIVTSDLGVGETTGVLGCPPGSGDDGVFVSESRAGGECAGLTIEPPWLQFDPTVSASDFNGDFECLATLGTDGCGLEQQLESSLRAVTTNAGAGGPHEGFLRSDSLVAIVYVTDEDDCSASDEAIFDPSFETEEELGHFRTRCAFHPELLHPTSRYVDAFKNLALDRRGDVIVAAITGVPRDLTEDPLDVDFEAVLADDRMQYQIDPDDETALVPACEFGGVGEAPPARRIIEVVEEFGRTGDGVLASICQPDLRPAIESIAALVAERLCDAPI